MKNVSKKKFLINGFLIRIVITNKIWKQNSYLVTDVKSGQAEIKNDKDGNIGISIGKKSFSDEKLIKNFETVIETLEKEKGNNTVKGNLIKNAYLTSTMGVSYKVKLSKIF